MTVVGRFAPSPTGRMHAGNIYAALLSWLIVRSQGGSIVLRIEDLDRERSKPSYADQIMRDFESLGLTWDRGPFYQSGRDDAYRLAFDALSQKTRVYPCFCTRADLRAASAPHAGERYVYAGTCRDIPSSEVERRSKLRVPSWRVFAPDAVYRVNDLVQGSFEQNLATDCGDFVVRRADGSFAYQLAVVADDFYQGVTCIVRGCDLLSSTPQQMYLQNLLGFGNPSYAHVPLLVDASGRRLSKRNRDASFDELIARYRTPEGIIGHIAYIAGVLEDDEPAPPAALLARFDLDRWKRRLKARGGMAQLEWR
ncbi:tRNA glutamyl-Q(34) synthetase GluQRS [Berryella intestinalis]|uniref:tRNA glutamyl-Q(34) synthetase GluQRS n=1 Tax=Berryella intestinalis TaxID=1531429 RepID=UPI0006911FFE|nr:tRNA glutamyl-Q(34) synthetase GluQRS [Berryella intestinalis]